MFGSSLKACTKNTWIIWANECVFWLSLNTSWNVAKTKLSAPAPVPWTQIEMSWSAFTGVGETTVALQIDKVRWFDIRGDILEERGHPPCWEELLKDFQVLFVDCFSSPSLLSWLLFTLRAPCSAWVLLQHACYPDSLTGEWRVSIEHPHIKSP